MSDELRDRFRDHQPDEEEGEDDGGEDGADSSSSPPTSHNAQTSESSDGPSDTSGSSSPDSSGGSGVSGGSDSSGNVRDRPQMSMYLPPDVKSRVEDDYEKLDAKSKLADQGGVRKNDDFFVGMIEFALEENRNEFEEYIGVTGE